MNTYTVTATYYEENVSTTISILIKANSRNDAFIIGASKIYAMFAGTTTEIAALGVNIHTE